METITRNAERIPFKLLFIIIRNFKLKSQYSNEARQNKEIISTTKQCKIEKTEKINRYQNPKVVQTNFKFTD